MCIFGQLLMATSAFSQHTQITGYQDNAGGQHIFYLDANSHLNQLYYLSGTSWQTQDLTALYGGNTPAAGSPLTSFVDSTSGQHVFYLDSNKHLNQIFYPGSGDQWIPQDLTGTYAPNIPGPNGTSLASVYDTEDGSEHVFYVDTSNLVDEMYYPGDGGVTTWSVGPISLAYGGNNAASSSPLAAFEDFSFGLHVIYLDSNNNINQLYNPGGATAWLAQDLTASYGGNVPASTSNLTTFLDTSQVQHIAYEDSSQHLNQLFYSGGTSWSAQDLTALYGGNSPEMASHLASYVDSASYQHIVYLDSNHHVNQLFYAGGFSWMSQDLTALYGGNTAGSGSVLVAFPLFGDDFMIGQHIAYLDGSDNVNQIYYPSNGGDAWFPQNLTATYGGNAPAIRPVFSLPDLSESIENQ